jgi:predicted transcriptional regulator YdeE
MAVYSNFESDETGEFDLTAGIKGGSPTAKNSEVTIPGGTYLRFEKKGTIPAVVIELWQEIWQFFARLDSPQRLFKCDFEEYQDVNSVAIYIGIGEEKND